MLWQMCLAFFQVNLVWEKTSRSEKNEFIIEKLLQVHLELQLFTMKRTKDIKEWIKNAKLSWLGFGQRREVNLIKFNYILVMFLRK